MPPPRRTCSMKAGSCCRSLVIRAMHCCKVVVNGKGRWQLGGCATRLLTRWWCGAAGRTVLESHRSRVVFYVLLCRGLLGVGYRCCMLGVVLCLQQGGLRLVWLLSLLVQLLCVWEKCAKRGAPWEHFYIHMCVLLSLFVVIEVAYPRCVQPDPWMRLVVDDVEVYAVHCNLESLCKSAPDSCHRSLMYEMCCKDRAFLSSLTARSKYVELVDRDRDSSLQDVIGRTDESEGANVTNMDGDVVECELRRLCPCLGVLRHRAHVDHWELVCNQP
eukprot:5378265-Amphidinium_carterae.1